MKRNRLKVLIAEDDENSSIHLSILLQNFSQDIVCVYTGNDAVEACKKHPDIDLVLMDIKMPRMNGYEATRKIREFNPGVVIIAQTAYALTGDREKAIHSGCNEYITKPIHKEVLFRIMAQFGLH